MNIEVSVPVQYENATPYGLNIGEGMRVAVNADKTVYECVIRLTGAIFLVINPLIGTSIHIGIERTETAEGDAEFAAKVGEKLPTGTIVKFTL
jgi:hypothetical protein